MIETELVGNHTYTWYVDSDDGQKNSPEQWQFLGGPRTFAD